MLLELKEYATEVDVDFVRRAVRAIGRCAIKLDKATERCINTLLDLIKTKVVAAYYHEYRVLLETLLVL